MLEVEAVMRRGVFENYVVVREIRDQVGAEEFHVINERCVTLRCRLDQEHEPLTADSGDGVLLELPRLTRDWTPSNSRSGG